MKSIEISGKTVKDAIKNGLNELGCDSSDVDIQVLEMGSPGLFGMFGRPAKVKLTVKDKGSDVDIEMPVLSLDQPSGKRRDEKRKDKPKAEKKPEPKPERTEKPEAEKPEAEQPAGEPAAEDKPRPEKKRRRSRGEKKPAAEPAANEQPTEVVIAPVEVEPFVATPEEELSETAKSARTFLSGLTERMGVPAEIAVSESEEQLRMVLSGENMSILIGRRGETLDAIQYLTSLNVNRAREDYLRVSLDTENYRAKREEALRKLAVRMAGRCKKSGRRVALEPMNPYERRILHSALQADPDVTTHSEGEEPYRRVIITLK
ncbi:MAG: RNA-binding cell elongation regulator Jag/EloR [Candidatus Faecivicinus sp.]